MKSIETERVVPSWLNAGGWVFYDKKECDKAHSSRNRSAAGQCQIAEGDVDVVLEAFRGVLRPYSRPYSSPSR